MARSWRWQVDRRTTTGLPETFFLKLSQSYTAAAANRWDQAREFLTASGLYTYPDAVVICGPIILSGETITNPTVLVEVLSPSTRAYDQGEKFELYRSIPTLRDYLLIEQNTIDVEHRWRDGDQWSSERKTSLEDVIRLNSIEVDLRIADLYARVQLD